METYRVARLREAVIAAGDFSQSVRSGAEAYFLRHIIHDWNDDQSRTILKNRHAAMMTVTGGQERTESGYRVLLDKCGFGWHRVVPTTTELSVIEAVSSLP